MPMQIWIHFLDSTISMVWVLTILITTSIMHHVTTHPVSRQRIARHSIYGVTSHWEAVLVKSTSGACAQDWQTKVVLATALPAWTIFAQKTPNDQSSEVRVEDCTWRRTVMADDYVIIIVYYKVTHSFDQCQSMTFHLCLISATTYQPLCLTIPKCIRDLVRNYRYSWGNLLLNSQFLMCTVDVFQSFKYQISLCKH